EHPKYPLYHISSGEVISQMKLAELIQQNAGDGTTIRDDTVGEGYRLVLDGRRYRKEFDGKIFVPYEEGVKAVVEYMKKYSSSFLQREDTGAGWGNRVWRLLVRIFRMLAPYLENLICFIPFFMIHNRAVGSQYFAKLDAYLLYVLLFAIVYGQQQAIFSALLATAGYCFRQMYNQSGLEVLMDYSTYIWMAQLFILGMVVGYMRDQIHHIKKDDQEEISYLHGQLGDMTEINDSNVRMKQIFELQLVNQKDSLGKIYEITSSLDQYGAYEVLFYAAQTISKLMNTEDVAVYTVANQSYARLFSFTSPTARKLGNSIRYPEMEAMYTDLKERRVFINKTMDERYPLMAQAIYAEDEMQIILMLWGLPWDRMNLAESNRLTVISYLIQNAVVRANRYLEALREHRYLGNSSILEKEAFTQLVSAFFEAKRNGLTECSLVKITCGEEKYLEAAEVLGKKLRQTDYVGMLDGGLYVLLSDTEEKNALGVITRFAEAGYESTIANGGGGRMSINGTLAFVILWIVNALIALVYLLVGIFLYVPACDLKREQGEEIQYDNRRAFFIRFIVMVLCPVVGPAFFLCSYLIYKTVFRQAVDLEDVIFSKERVQTHLKADEERERNMALLEESLAVSDKRNMRMLMLNVIRGDMQKSLESITMALNSEDSETSHYAASVLRDELNDFRSNVQKMYTQMQQETETETECEEMLIDYMNRILSQKIFTTMEQTKYVNMLEEAAESLYQKNGARITADRYEGLCLKLLDLKKIPETEKWCMRLARQHGNALAAYTCRLKLYFTMGEKEKFFEVLQELKESDIIIDNETLELIRIFS
ncbi:MAG: hypothetical protein ACLVJU_02330, partial [Blautia sp.]